MTRDGRPVITHPSRTHRRTGRRWRATLHLPPVGIGGRACVCGDLSPWDALLCESCGWPLVPLCYVRAGS